MYTWMLVAGPGDGGGHVLYGLDKSYKPFTCVPATAAAGLCGGDCRRAWAIRSGAIAGGFVIAFSEVMITYAWKKVAGYLIPAWEPEGLVQLLSTDYKFAVSFVILLIVLLIKPTGLFKGKAV